MRWDCELAGRGEGAHFHIFHFHVLTMQSHLSSFLRLNLSFGSPQRVGSYQECTKRVVLLGRWLYSLNFTSYRPAASTPQMTPASLRDGASPSATARTQPTPRR